MTAKKYTVVCSRCNALFTGIDANRQFDRHTCTNMRDLMTMPMDLLKAVIDKRMTEAQAWAEADDRVPA